jgi:hypothetical protein
LCQHYDTTALDASVLPMACVLSAGCMWSARSRQRTRPASRSTPACQKTHPGEATLARQRHENLRCPARGLEPVVYDLAAAGSISAVAAFELNLNTGAEMKFLSQLAPDQTQSHWFAIDRGILREHVIALAGPKPQDVFGPIPYAALLGALAQSLSWHAGGNARSDDGVLNSFRALRFAKTRVWSAKEAAGTWALEQGADVDTILVGFWERAGGPAVGSQQATSFVAAIEREIELMLLTASCQEFLSGRGELTGLEEEKVGVAGNGNSGCASPVHHEGSILRPSTASLRRQKPHG